MDPTPCPTGKGINNLKSGLRMRSTRYWKTPRLLVLTIAICLFIEAEPSLSEVFKSVDEKGKISFSDTPSAGAQAIKVEPPNTAVPVETTVKPVAPAPTEADPYTQLSITSPKDGAMIVNGLLPFTVTTQVTPPLIDGHKLQLSLNGSVHSTSTSSFEIPSIPRGQHQLEVAVLDSSGNVVKKSSPITIYARRPSSQN
jgi:hypothetical protein